MDDFERDLRATLARRDPGEDFTARVLARVDSAARIEAPVPIRKPARRWSPVVGAIAAGLAIVSFGAIQYRDYQRGVEAKRQLMFALELTAEKLHVAQQTVNRQTTNRRN